MKVSNMFITAVCVKNTTCFRKLRLTGRNLAVEMRKFIIKKEEKV